MKKTLIIASALIAGSAMAYAQAPMGDPNMSQAQKDSMARQSRPEIRNSETKPPNATTGSAQSPGGKSDPATQSLQNSGSGGSGGSGSGGGGAGSGR